MNNEVSDKTYPVQKRWILKPLFSLISNCVLIFIFSLFIKYDSQKLFYYLLIIITIAVGRFLLMILSRKNFQYVLEHDYLNLKQGIISKKESHIPYEVIQNVFVQQDILDRLFGITSLTLENAAMNGGSQPIKNNKQINYGQYKTESLGLNNGRIRISGLSKIDAENLKNNILNKIKDRATINVSGL